MESIWNIGGSASDLRRKAHDVTTSEERYKHQPAPTYSQVKAPPDRQLQTLKQYGTPGTQRASIVYADPNIEAINKRSDSAWDIGQRFDSSSSDVWDIGRARMDSPNVGPRMDAIKRRKYIRDGQPMEEFEDDETGVRVTFEE